MKIFYWVLGGMAFFGLLSSEVYSQDFVLSEGSNRVALIKSLYFNSMNDPENFEEDMEVIRGTRELIICIGSFESQMRELSKKFNTTCELAFQGEEKVYRRCIVENPLDKLRIWAHSIIESLDVNVPWTSTAAGSTMLVSKGAFGPKAHEQFVTSFYNQHEPFITNSPCELQ